MLDIYTLGEDVLRKECSEVKVFDSALKMLADAMLETLEEADGVGLAGPQVGVSERIFVIHIPDNPPIVFVNPEIIQTSIETSPYEEGCLSIPDISGNVIRSQKIIIRYTDPETIETVRDTVEGYTAVIFQHEADHLDGILFTDKVVNTGPGR